MAEIKICRVCGDEIDKNSKYACDSCMPFWKRAKRKWKKRNSDYRSCEEMAKDLKEIFINQDEKCALTGISLSLDGRNLWHVDRKIPGGRYNKENIQILLSSVNVSKWDNDNPAFAQMCALVVCHMIKNRDKFSTEVNDIEHVLKESQIVITQKD